LSPYAEQWYELEQLKASVRSLSHAAGLPKSPQPTQVADETLASALSSGSLSVEALNEVGLQDSMVSSQNGTTQEGRLASSTVPFTYWHYQNYVFINICLWIKTAVFSNTSSFKNCLHTSDECFTILDSASTRCQRKIKRAMLISLETPLDKHANQTS